jgi:hypothetical protein
MNGPDTALAGYNVSVSRADHAGEAYEPDISDCREAVGGRAGLDYIAHLSAGTWNFSVGLVEAELRREDFDQAGRQLSLVVARIDETAEQLDSGPLIRVVVQGDGGALFHILKVAGQNYFAATRNGARESVDRVDLSLAQLADRAAARIGSPSMLWGGYRKRGQSVDMWPPGGTAPTAEYPVRKRIRGKQTVDEATASRCVGALNRNDIHFVGIYRYDTLLWRADLFDDPALVSFFQQVTPAGRRHGYDKVLRQVMLQDGRLMRLLALVRSGELTRLVLDVARGAIYILPLDRNGHYLVGVTLIQAQVEDGDKKITALHRDLVATAFSPGGPFALPASLRYRPRDGDG